MVEIKPEDERSDEEIAKRMERGLRRALNTPPQPHGSPIDEQKKRRITSTPRTRRSVKAPPHS
jgi:hypothetical protein